jgi:hypothetical protein
VQIADINVQDTQKMLSAEISKNLGNNAFRKKNYNQKQRTK